MKVLIVGIIIAYAMPSATAFARDQGSVAGSIYRICIEVIAEAAAGAGSSSEEKTCVGFDPDRDPDDVISELTDTVIDGVNPFDFSATAK